MIFKQVIFVFQSVVFASIAAAISLNSYGQDLPITTAEHLGFDPIKLERIEALVNQGIAEGNMPGCVICFGRRDKICYLRAFGQKQIEPQTEPMTVDTVFDLASLTKPIATATSIMKLVERGELRLGSRVVDFFPEFAPHGKDKITIQDLLIHQSGLIPDNPLADYLQGKEIAWKKICELKPTKPVGLVFQYSDVNFIVLAEIIEKISGNDVHAFSQQHLFQPLGMEETGFVLDKSLKIRAAPTERRSGGLIKGEVHDPRALALGGVAGHAGLFSTATDLARYASMMLGEGTLEVENGQSIEILSPRTVAAMTQGYTVSGGQRGLGWDRRTGYSSSRGDLLSDSAYGHGGFTGTVLWIDPELDVFYIFLSSRLHPDGKGVINPVAGQIANVIAGASPSSTEPRTRSEAEVLPGLDVLERDHFRLLSGQRVGVITNHTGRNRNGIGIVKLLHESLEVDLRVVFSPEHGFTGELDSARIDDGVDAQTGLPIYSLYGQTRRPTAEMCQEIDTLVFDIQDIGTRFYTYISTMGEALLAAAELKISFVVLDRPNPIGGTRVLGPMLDAGSESFVGFHRMPIRHGMTIGEIALLLKEELNLDVDLKVIPCEGWTRDMRFDKTGLMWINPSPNIRNLTQALLYPGVGILETTNLSVGRGTDTPFEVIGAPWIEGRTFAAALNELRLPGVTFVPVEFTPAASKFTGKCCQGINLIIVDRQKFEPMQTGFGIAVTLRTLYPNEWETRNLNRLLGNRECLEAILAGGSLESILLKASAGVSNFLRRRERHLLYR